MQLALIIDDYFPHSTRVGAKMFHELAIELMNLGHKVTVITPHFDVGEKTKQYSVDGVEVWSFYSGPIKDIGKIKRAVNESLMSARAWSALKHKIKTDTFDGIVYYSPSIFFGQLVSSIKKRCRCPAYLVLRDFFPQWAIDAGMIKQGSFIAKYFKYFERKSYAQSDMIGVMSEKNLKIFESVHHGAYPTTILRNWAALQPYRDTNSAPSFRKKLSLQDKVIFFYGGNIGHAQDMANLMRLARAMQIYHRAHFLFVGQGDEVELINRLAKEWQLDNFTYLPSINQDEFKRVLSEVDIGLFSLSAKHTAHNFPGKLLGYMVQSLPILGSVNQGNDLLDLVNECGAGFISVNGEDNLLLENAIALCESSELRKKMGTENYKLLKDEFSVHSIATSIVNQLEVCSENYRDGYSLPTL